MANITYIIYTYRCPKCKLDLGRRFGLITSKCVTCARCGGHVLITTPAVSQNWAMNFGVAAGGLLWVILTVGVLFSPEFAAKASDLFLRGAGVRNPLAIVGVCLLPAFVVGLVAGVVGSVLGTIAGLCMSSEPDDDSDWVPDGALYWPRSPAGPRRRSLLVRVLFILLWPFIFLFGTAAVIEQVVGAENNGEVPRLVVAVEVSTAAPALAADRSKPALPAGNEAGREKTDAPFPQEAAPWLLLGMLLVFIAGCCGWLPCTSRKSRPETTADGPRRHPLLRFLFVVLWPVVFLVAASVVLMLLDGRYAAESQEELNRLREQSTQQAAPWVCLTFLLLFVLGSMGILPGTGRRRRRALGGAAE
jgi:hypothetical protein